MSYPPILDADVALGPCDMTFDSELAEFEAAEGHARLGGWSAFPLPSQHLVYAQGFSPSSLDQMTDQLLAASLDSLG